MREQTAGGHIFNMDGAGADGGATPRFAAYGATKRSLAQLSKSLQVILAILPGTVYAQEKRADATVRRAQASRRSMCCWLSGSSGFAGGAEAPEHQQCRHPQSVAWHGDH